MNQVDAWFVLFRVVIPLFGPTAIFFIIGGAEWLFANHENYPWKGWPDPIGWAYVASTSSAYASYVFLQNGRNGLVAASAAVWAVTGLLAAVGIRERAKKAVRNEVHSIGALGQLAAALLAIVGVTFVFYAVIAGSSPTLTTAGDAANAAIGADSGVNP